MERHSRVALDMVEPIMVPGMAIRATVTRDTVAQDTPAVLTAIRGMEETDMEIMDMATILAILDTILAAMEPTMERIMANMVNFFT